MHNQKFIAWQHGAAKEGDNTYAWMFTMSDLLLLLLTTFVMRYAMTSLDTAVLRSKFPIRGASIEQSSTKQPGNKLPMATPEEAVDSEQKHLQFFDIIRRNLGNLLAQNLSGGQPNSSERVRVSVNDKYIAVQIPASALIEGSDELSLLAAETAGIVAKSLNGNPAEIQLISVADPAEEGIFPQRFSSPWELAQARAMALLRQMIDAGIDAKNLSVIGYADPAVVPCQAFSQSSQSHSCLEIRLIEADG